MRERRGRPSTFAPLYQRLDNQTIYTLTEVVNEGALAGFFNNPHFTGEDPAELKKKARHSLLCRANRFDLKPDTSKVEGFGVYTPAYFGWRLKLTLNHWHFSPEAYQVLLAIREEYDRSGATSPDGQSNPQAYPLDAGTGSPADSPGRERVSETKQRPSILQSLKTFGRRNPLATAVALLSTAMLTAASFYVVDGFGLLKSQGPDSAIDNLEAASDRGDMRPAEQLQLAWSYFAKSDFSRSQNLTNKLLHRSDLTPRLEGDTFFLRGKIASREGRYQQAVHFLGLATASYQTKEKKKDVTIATGVLWVKRGDYLTGIDILENVLPEITQATRRGDVFLFLSDAYFWAGQWQEAFRSNQEAEREYAKSPPLLGRTNVAINKAWLYAHSDQPNVAARLIAELEPILRESGTQDWLSYLDVVKLLLEKRTTGKLNPELVLELAQRVELDQDLKRYVDYILNEEDGRVLTDLPALVKPQTTKESENSSYSRENDFNDLPVVVDIPMAPIEPDPSSSSELNSPPTNEPMKKPDDSDESKSPEGDKQSSFSRDDDFNNSPVVVGMPGAPIDPDPPPTSGFSPLQTNEPTKKPDASDDPQHPKEDKQSSFSREDDFNNLPIIEDAPIAPIDPDPPPSSGFSPLQTNEPMKKPDDSDDPQRL